jgi:membrane protein YdbS with pleckstrin-like domain
MSGDWLGGGVVWALAAALWVVYLIPTWLRRRSFLATERNAVRLQQTLRILAESAEVPEHVRAEATAREVAAQQRTLRATETRRRAEEKAQAMELAQAEKAAREALHRVAVQTRRSAQTGKSALRWRQSAALAVLLGLLGGIVGLVLLAFGGSWLVPVIAGALFTLGFATLIMLAPGRKRTSATVATAPSAAQPAAYRPAEVFEAEIAEHDVEAVPVPEEEAPGWTPQPLPKPLYLSRGSVAASAMASIDAVERMRAAAAEAELAQRAAAAAPEVAPIRTPRQSAPVAEPTKPTSRFASMGVIDGVDAIDLDQALQRRRGA